MIIIKSLEEIKTMREGGKILAQIVKGLKEIVEPGITTKRLNKAAEDLIFKFKVKPAFKNYQGFPATLCTSIDEEVVHSIPSDRKLKNGNIISLDMGLIYKGFYADMAVTVPVGEISPEAQRLIRVTKKALKRGIKKARPGNTFGDIGNTIQRYVEDQGCNVVRELSGHGIGKELHEDPRILNYGKRESGPEIREGMVFCIEPMVIMGDWQLKKAGDGYGYQTRDNSLSAHFEHMMAVTKTGCEILTDLK